MTNDHHPMTPTTDHGWIYEALERLRTDMQQQHVRLRDDMNRGFDALRMEIRRETDRVDDHSDRITMIETARTVEEKAAVKHGTWAGIMTSIGANALFYLVRWVQGK
jgi:hypothetical protein